MGLGRGGGRHVAVPERQQIGDSRRQHLPSGCTSTGPVFGLRVCPQISASTLHVPMHHCRHVQRHVGAAAGGRRASGVLPRCARGLQLLAAGAPVLSLAASMHAASRRHGQCEVISACSPLLGCSCRARSNALLARTILPCARPGRGAFQLYDQDVCLPALLQVCNPCSLAARLSADTELAALLCLPACTLLPLPALLSRRCPTFCSKCW